MDSEHIAAAMRRAERILARRPEVGMSDDSVATARWEGGLRIRTSHAEGHAVETDMPVELGGSGERVSPGWLMRAGLAACLATSIALQAAARGVVLTHLNVRATSKSDLRGLLGMPDDTGVLVGSGPRDVELRVQIAAASIPAAEVREIVAEAHRCAPVSAALAEAAPVHLVVDVQEPAI